MVGFTQRWDIFRARGIEGQRDEEEECAHEDDREGGPWICTAQGENKAQQMRGCEGCKGGTGIRDVLRNLLRGGS